MFVGISYIGEIRRSISTKVNKQERAARLEKDQISDVVELIHNIITIKKSQNDYFR